jgi:acyl dehydratase
MSMLRLTGAEEVKPHAGRDVSVSEWQLVTQEAIDAFAVASGDDQWSTTLARAGRATEDIATEAERRAGRASSESLRVGWVD